MAAMPPTKRPTRTHAPPGRDRRAPHAAPAQPTLRLVNTARRAGETSPSPSAPSAAPRFKVPAKPTPHRPSAHTPATRESAGLCASDPRWVLAVRTAHYLDAGRAGLLAPDKRDHLIKTAQHLGIRPFDAHLVIAIVQDAARMGLPPLSPDTAQRLSLLELPKHKPAPPRNPSLVQTLLGITITTACLLTAALLWLHN